MFAMVVQKSCNINNLKISVSFLQMPLIGVNTSLKKMAKRVSKKMSEKSLLREYE